MDVPAKKIRHVPSDDPEARRSASFEKSREETID
jgi:hypothetical protein